MTATPHSVRFLESPLRTFFALWVPVLFSLVAEPATGLVDTAFVSRMGADSLAALGVGTMILSSVFWIAIRACLGILRIWPAIGKAPLKP